MNFFQEQEKAKKNTIYLVVLFIIGVIGTILMANVVVAIAMAYYDGVDSLVFDSDTFILSSIAIVVIVAIGSGYKYSELSSGGHVVAEALGGTLIPHDTSDSNHRQLLNVVDEMSIASGISAPPVYLLEQSGINAFAAGLSYDDAVIGVTKGAVETFNREELQGVIAHEFSHIFNGDMRLNIRITGLLHGILLIGLIGREILNSFNKTRHIGGSRSSKKGDVKGAIIIIAIGFTIVGFIGTTFGEMIKALISRQREFLADASAVQFTRYPQGIANALRKIGANSSSIKASSASTYSHFYFADAISGFWNSLFSTHPKLDDRIRRIDPRWDGSYIEDVVKKEKKKEEKKTTRKEDVVKTVATAVIIDAMDKIGSIDAKRVQGASALLKSIPKSLKSMSENPFSAQALVYALLCSSDEKIRNMQKESITKHSDVLVKQTQLALISIERLERDSYLPLMQLCVTSLKMMSLAQYKEFREYAKQLIDMDDKLSLLEWNIQHLIFRPLDIYFELRTVPREKYSNIGAIRDEVTFFISVLAKEQKEDEKSAEEAFDFAKKSVKASSLKYVSNELETYSKLESAVFHLESAKLGVRKKVLSMAIAALEHDGEISSEDLEILNSVSLILRLPLPLTPKFAR